MKRVNLTINFTPQSPPTSTPVEIRDGVPNVSHGFFFSDGFSRAWLFGGESNNNASVANTIWRFEPERATEPWTLLDVGRDKVSPRIHSGAGCNVPWIGTGFYLGGVSTAADNSVQYNHRLAIFNMRTESIDWKPVPDFVPVVNQRLVHLKAGEGHGVLVALAGQTERNKILSVVSVSRGV